MAIWLLLVAIVGIILQVIMVIGFVLYHTEDVKVQTLELIATTIKSRFLMFLLINLISSILLALAMFSGACASASYASNIQAVARAVPGCDKCEQLRSSQAASAVRSS